MTRTLDATLLHVLRTRIVQDYPDQIRACLQALTDDQTWWRPNDRANSIGNLVLHVCGSTRFYIGHCIGEVEFVRDRAAEFTERRPIPRDDLVRRLDEVIAESDRILADLDPAGLMEITERSGKSTSYAQILIHVAQHLATHTGQIVYATKLLAEGAVGELAIKTRPR